MIRVTFCKQLINKQETVVLALLDLSSAFDSVDHKILLSWLHNMYDITDTALDWLCCQSVLTASSLAHVCRAPKACPVGYHKDQFLGPYFCSIHQLVGFAQSIIGYIIYLLRDHWSSKQVRVLHYRDPSAEAEWWKDSIFSLCIFSTVQQGFGVTDKHRWLRWVFLPCGLEPWSGLWPGLSMETHVKSRCRSAMAHFLNVIAIRTSVTQCATE